jgi:Flp pilus assembly protein TadB
VSTAPDTAYREGMGKLILIILAALVVFMIVSLVISALHFLFWFAVVAVVILGALRLSGAVRRRSRQ